MIPSASILRFFSAGMDPYKTIAILRKAALIGSVYDEISLLSRALDAVGIFPLNFLGPDMLVEPFHIDTVLRHNGYEFSVVVVNVGQILRAAQFTVRNVDKVFLLKQVPQTIPVGLMGCIVRAIPIKELETHGNIAIRNDVEAEYNLLTVRAMVFVESEHWLDRTILGNGVLAQKGDRRTVIMNLLGFQLVYADRVR